jgi:CRP/FNR family transcriptional regulator, cyclic AMP receptor protein
LSARAMCYASNHMAQDEIVEGFPWAKGITAQPYSLAEISNILESTSWADNLSGKEIAMLSRYLHVCTAEAGSIIVQQGRREAYLCLIIEGHVSVMKEGAIGGTKQIGSAGAGRIVGEMSLIDGEPRSASVVADEPTTLVVLTGEGFSRLSDENARLAVKILLKISKLISQRLRQTSGALVDYLGG